MDNSTTGQEAIDAFIAAHDGNLIQAWAYSPNGGNGGPGGESAVITQERFREQINGLDCDDFSFDGETLTYCFSLSPSDPGWSRSVQQFYHWKVEPVSGYEGPAVACLGAHYGFMWGSSCEEIPVRQLTAADRTAMLRELLEYCNYSQLSTIGLGLIGDPTDDGHNWVVTDNNAFDRILSICRQTATKPVSDLIERFGICAEMCAAVLEFAATGQPAEDLADSLRNRSF